MGRLKIISAKYGRRSILQVDVTARLESLIEGDELKLPGGALSYNRLLGYDPTPGYTKVLEVLYKYDDGPIQWYIACEDENFKIIPDELRDGYKYNGEK